MKTIILVSGYSSAGKDSFCIDPSLFEVIPNEKEISSSLSESEISPSLSESEISPSLSESEISFIFTPRKKFAFADAVKEEIYPFLFPNIKREEYSLIPREEKEKYRNIIIEYAQKRKEEDPYYWAKIVEKEINSKNEENSFFISDWRFPEELEYFRSLASASQQDESNSFKIYTVRVKSNYVVESKYQVDKLLDEYPFDLIVKWKEF